MAKKKIGLSRDLIIHAGETLKELLEDRQISQAALSKMTGFSQKHISEVVNGLASITPDFAYNLAKSFDGIGANFWLKLQNAYDLEILEHEDRKQENKSSNNLPAIDVAMWFLDKHKNTENPDEFEPLTKLKLQKLLYYAQGFFAKEKGRMLFGENILAWENGPVVKEVYDVFKTIDGREIPFDVIKRVNMDSSIERVLELVYEKLGQYSAWKLRNMTHNETPWKTTPRNNVIPWIVIKQYFDDNFTNYVA
jgi:addiction module HigA family antidote